MRIPKILALTWLYCAVTALEDYNGSPGDVEFELARCREAIGEPSYPHKKKHVGRGCGIRNGGKGAVRLPKILVLTIGGFSVGAQRASRV